MKLPDLLKKAVLEQDWKTVCVVYTAITGEPLSPPEPKKEANLFDMEISEDLLAELGIGDSQADIAPPLVSEDEDEGEPEPLKKKEVGQKSLSSNRESFISKARDTDKLPANKRDDGKVEARKEPMQIPKSRKNVWEDDLTIAPKLIKANNSQLEILYGPSHDKTPKEEKEKETGEVNVVCSFCGQANTVVKSLAVGYNSNPEENTYECTSCCTPSGRAKVLRQQRELAGSGRRK